MPRRTFQREGMAPDLRFQSNTIARSTLAASSGIVLNNVTVKFEDGRIEIDDVQLCTMIGTWLGYNPNVDRDAVHSARLIWHKGSDPTVVVDCQC